VRGARAASAAGRDAPVPQRRLPSGNYIAAGRRRLVALELDALRRSAVPMGREFVVVQAKLAKEPPRTAAAAVPLNLSGAATDSGAAAGPVLWVPQAAVNWKSRNGSEYIIAAAQGKDQYKKFLAVQSTVGAEGGRPPPTPKSRYTGVAWHKPGGKWRSSIYHNAVLKHLGYFGPDEEEFAARAVDDAARVLRGAAAHRTWKASGDRSKLHRLNFPTPEEEASAGAGGPDQDSITAEGGLLLPARWQGGHPSVKRQRAVGVNPARASSQDRETAAAGSAAAGSAAAGSAAGQLRSAAAAPTADSGLSERVVPTTSMLEARLIGTYFTAVI
jgi:hypothetical protein